MTGYLTKTGKVNGKRMELEIPNLEIRDIFVRQIMDFFKESVKKDGETLQYFCDALKHGEADRVEQILGDYLKKTISIRDTFVRKNIKENFYHGILLGILGVKTSWGISSNRETGDGYADVLVEPDDEDIGIIIEVKYAEDGNLDAACKEALEQIELTRYAESFENEGITNILKYGIACYKKRCRVLVQKNKINI